MNIGESLKNHRENAGLSKYNLAVAVTINHQNISRWENNQCLPNILDCITLAKFYGITIDELLGIQE